MSFQHLGKGALRVAKNYTKGYSDVQAKVRDATSNDPWGPSGTQMNEVAQLTYNQNDFVEIMEMLDKRLNDKGKNWRHVFKALTLLDYCLHAGSENVVIYFRDNVYLVKTLKEFQYIDEYGKDQGANVRQKAKDITNLLQDESRLRQERRSRANMRDRMIRGGPGGEDTPDDENNQRRSRSTPGGSRRNREDEELQKALEASKQSAELEAQKTVLSAEERDLQRALKLSEEEELKRAKAVEETNSKSLFDDSTAQDGTSQAAIAVSTNPFPLVDASALQPQYTLQPQFTIQPQITSFNPYLAQQQQEAQQLAWAQQQQEWQQQEWLRQQTELQAAQAQAQLQAQNDWAMQQMQLQQMQQMQTQQQALQQQALQQQQQQQQQQTSWLQVQSASPLVAQPTGFGSKNPFALSSGSAVQPVPQLPTLAPSHSPGPAPSRSAPPTTSSAPTVKVSDNPDNAALAALFANREGGTDTFGNIGNLRFGHTSAGRTLAATQTGPAQQSAHNDQPFFSV